MQFVFSQGTSTAINRQWNKTVEILSIITNGNKLPSRSPFTRNTHVFVDGWQLATLTSFCGKPLARGISPRITVYNPFLQVTFPAGRSIGPLTRTREFNERSSFISHSTSCSLAPVLTYCGQKRRLKVRRVIRLELKKLKNVRHKEKDVLFRTFVTTFTWSFNLFLTNVLIYLQLYVMIYL